MASRTGTTKVNWREPSLVSMWGCCWVLLKESMMVRWWKSSMVDLMEMKKDRGEALMIVS